MKVAAALLGSLASAAMAFHVDDPIALDHIHASEGCTPSLLQAACPGCEVMDSQETYMTAALPMNITKGIDFSVIVTAEEALMVENMGCTVVLREPSRALSAAPPTGYTRPEELFAQFTALASDFPDVAQLIDVTETYRVPTTAEGRHIYVLKLSDHVQEDEDEPNVLMISGHHAREIITPELAYFNARKLIEGYKNGDSNIVNIMEENQIYIAWTWNPDGLQYVWDVNNMWRKNRRPNSNSFGVDLNRNYPFGWDFSCGGSTNQASDTYRGPSAGSEPEIVSSLAFFEDRNFAKYFDFHSSGRDVRFNYPPCASMPAALYSYYQEVALEFAQAMNYVTRISCCTGDAFANAYHGTGSMAYLSETGTSFQPPAATMRAELERIWPGVATFLKKPLGIVGHVVDAASGEGIAAMLEIDELQFSHGEVKRTDVKFGRFHLMVPPGEWRVRVTSTTGEYTSKFASVVVPNATSVNVEIELDRVIA